MRSILAVDDDELLLKALARTLRSEPYDLTTIADPRQALELCRTKQFDLIISDQRMPGMIGTELLKGISKLLPESRRIMLSGYADFNDVVASFNEGVLHKFILKPWDNTLLRQQIAEILGDKAASSEARGRGTVLGTMNFHGLISCSARMHRVITFIRNVAPSGAPLYICGETGTGKEVIAKAFHKESARSRGPFVALNCANLTESLLESQLFGHRKGAFTGAHSDQRGLLEEANGGTLFLDEVIEMPLGLQARLLRVLQEREFTPLGETKPRRLDVQIISAAAMTLSAAVDAGKFRADLRFRLDILPVQLPPLRERREEIPLLVTHFLNGLLSDSGHDSIEMDDEVMELLLAHDWPGNVRELQNACVYMAALLPTNNYVLDLSCLPDALVAQHHATPQHAADKTPALSKGDIVKALDLHKGNRSAAARYLSVSRMTLWRKMKEFALAD